MDANLMFVGVIVLVVGHIIFILLNLFLVVNDDGIMNEKPGTMEQEGVMEG